MEGVSETLAGRAVYVTLWPMTRSEADGRGSTGRWDTFLEQPPEECVAALGVASHGTLAPWTDLALREGYPDPALTLRSSEDRGAWFEGYLRTYLERDLQQLASIDHLVAFQRLTCAAALAVEPCDLSPPPCLSGLARSAYVPRSLHDLRNLG